jgi:hypothetical protein
MRRGPGCRGLGVEVGGTGSGCAVMEFAKSQVQALDCTAPILPLRPGIPERRRRC